MIVTSENFSEVLETLKGNSCYGIDTETYGISYAKRLFSFAIDCLDGCFYFNFKNYDTENPVLDYSCIEQLNQVFNSHSVIFAHNAKFDMHKLAKEGLRFPGTIHCTLAAERLINNSYDSYSLDACAQRRGHQKDDKVMEYIKKHKLWTQKQIPGKLRKEKSLRFFDVPFGIISAYCCKDAQLTRQIGEDQMFSLCELDQQKVYVSQQKLWRVERDLTKVLFHMEAAGLKTRPNYIINSWNSCNEKLKTLKQEFEQHSGIAYKNGPKILKQAFDICKKPYQINSETLNPIFNKQALDKMESPIAKIVKQIRHYEAHIQTYYSSFIYHADRNQTIHANIMQSGTTTGRMSCREPNLQNIPKRGEEGNEFPVRGCFVPRKDYCFVMIDYDQMEYRMMADYANEEKLISAIMKGEDVHDATARLIGNISRSNAKTINFGLLYGMGVTKLAQALNISLPEAKRLKQRYFSTLPNIEMWVRKVIRTAENRGFIFNWLGRRYYITDKKFAYKVPNGLIQGGCADVVKLAMVDIAAFLQGMKSRMLLQIHDELLFEVHKDELHIIAQLKAIMESAYKPFNGMRLTCSVEHSWISWGTKDRVDGWPSDSTAISVH